MHCFVQPCVPNPQSGFYVFFCGASSSNIYLIYLIHTRKPSIIVLKTTGSGSFAGQPEQQRAVYWIPGASRYVPSRYAGELMSHCCCKTSCGRRDTLTGRTPLCHWFDVLVFMFTCPARDIQCLSFSSDALRSLFGALEGQDVRIYALCVKAAFSPLTTRGRLIWL